MWRIYRVFELSSKEELIKIVKTEKEAQTEVKKYPTEKRSTMVIYGKWRQNK